MYIDRTIKCLKRLQKRSIDDNLRQLVLIRQDRVLENQSTCFFTSDPGIIFFFTFRKKWVGRAMGNEPLSWDGLRDVNRVRMEMTGRLCRSII